MAHFVAEDEESFRYAHLLDGVVPHHHTFGGTKASHIGIERSDLLTGIHLIHAAAGDLESAALDNLFNLLYQFGLAVLQWFEVIIQRINRHRGNENHEE